MPREPLIFVPSHESSNGRRENDLRLEPVRLHHVAAGQQVVELVGAAELDVRLDGDRVVRLHERVEQLRDGDRLLRREPLREVVALENPRDGHRPRQSKDLGEVDLASHSLLKRTSVRSGIDDRRGGLEVARRVPVDLLGRDDRTLGRRPDGSPMRVV